jgi:hypothetical protein
MARQAVIGLIGKAPEYYRIINREVRRRLGGVHSPRSLMWSVDFGEIEHLQHQGDWDELARRMIDAAGPCPCRSRPRLGLGPVPAHWEPAKQAYHELVISQRSNHIALHKFTCHTEVAPGQSDGVSP